MIQAKVIADSIGQFGDRLTTLEVIMPRYILAEKNTHRVFTKNSASSRAIPLRKMILSVINNTFIPYAWQKEHSGMQGSEYLDSEKKYSLVDFMDKAKEFLTFKDREEDNNLDLYLNIMTNYKHKSLRLEEWWLLARDKALEIVAIFGIFGVTKQLANRLLEPFMYHKVLVSGTEWQNFFNLRCPDYEFHNIEEYHFKSRKEVIAKFGKNEIVEYFTGDIKLKDLTILHWLALNKGQADIHMMFLAEAIYDAINESIPKKLKEGEWHIPYGDNLDDMDIKSWVYENSSMSRNEFHETATLEYKLNISTARCARLSYQTLGDNPIIDFGKDIELFNDLIVKKPIHASPAEHPGQNMTNKQYFSHSKSYSTYTLTDKIIKEKDAGITNYEVEKDDNGDLYYIITEYGWCRNYRGFIMYRAIIEC